MIDLAETENFGLMSGYEMKRLLPLESTSTEKGMATLCSALNEFLGEYIENLATEDSSYLDPKAYESEALRGQISSHIIRIGLGIPCFDLKQDWKT